MKSFIHAILKILSYVFDIPIENHPSIISGEITVKRVNNKIWVDTKKVNYSFGSLHHVFEIALKKINPFEKFPVKNILILGFGAGSIYEILRKQMNYEGMIIGIEIDEVMIRIFRKYIFKKDDSLLLFQQDILYFLKTNSSKTDMIIVDVFVQDEVPEMLIHKDVIQLMESQINRPGYLIWNVMISTKDQKNKMEKIKDLLEIKDTWFQVGDDNVILYKKI